MAKAPAALKRSVRNDPHGDTMLVQISPQEGALLQHLGGAGVRNPRTGLLQFYAGGATAAGNNAAHEAVHNSYGGGSSSGNGGSHGGGMSQAQANAIMGMGGAAAAPSAPGPAPTFSRNLSGPTGPRPGTADRWGTTIEQNPDIQQQQTQYNSAANALQNRSFGDFLGDRALDLIPGFHQVTPDWTKPSTYAGGQYHDAWSPLSAVMGAGGAFLGPGGGLVGGELGTGLTTAIGLPDYKFGSGGGWNPSNANPIQSAMGQNPNPSGMPSSQQTAQNQGRQNSAADHLQQLAQLNTGIPGNPAAPVNSGTATAAATGLPGPNYSQMMARMQPITPNYGVQLPGYQYAGRTGATV